MITLHCGCAVILGHKFYCGWHGFTSLAWTALALVGVAGLLAWAGC